MRKTSLMLFLLLSVALIATSHARVHQDASGQQVPQATQSQETQSAQQTQQSQETQAPEQTQQVQQTQPVQETQAPQQTQQAQQTQPVQETQAPQQTQQSTETQAQETQAPQQTQQVQQTQPVQETQAPQQTQQVQQTQAPQSSENQGSQSSEQSQQLDISKSGEIFYGAMLAGESRCDVNSKANSVQLPEFLVGNGRVEISSGAGYLGAISAMTAALEERVKAKSMTSDLLSVLLPKALIAKLQGDFQARCSLSNQSSEQNNQTQENNSNNNQGSNTKGGINRRQAGTSNQNCNLLENFITFDANAERQARTLLQEFSPVSSPNGLRENSNDPKEQLFISSNLWGLVIDRLLVLLGGERINPTLTSHWKNVVKTQWLSLNSSSLIDLEMLAMWAFATDDVSDEWDSTLSFRYEALSIRGKIFYAFYLKNRNVNAGLTGVTLARERIDLYQNVLKLAMDRIRIDHFGNTAFVTVADFPDGPERPDYQATAMLVFLITKFGIPFDLKPTKMANFLASFGRQGDLEFPIEKFKAFNNSRELAWAIVALATRQITLEVDLELRVVSDSQEVLRHQFKRCCDAFVKTSYSRFVEISAGKTVSFVACGSGDISIALRFIWDVNQNSSSSTSSSEDSSSNPTPDLSTRPQDLSTRPQELSTQPQDQSGQSQDQSQGQSTQSQDQSQSSVGQDQTGQGN